MLRVTKLTDYATVVLTVMAGKPDAVHCAADLAERARLELPTVSKVLKPLAHAGLVEGFRGVINTTCNFILSELERGVEFERALADMQARGIAEADPTLDVDGWDAAAKTAALVNVLMGSVITPHHVARTGIRDVTGADVREAVGRNKRIRLVASASRQGGKLKARVEPEVLDLHDPLAGVDDLSNALYLTTDLLGEVGIVQRSGNLTQTAYALLSDLSRISQRLKEI